MPVWLDAGFDADDFPLTAGHAETHLKTVIDKSVFFGISPEEKEKMQRHDSSEQQATEQSSASVGPLRTWPVRPFDHGRGPCRRA